MTQFCNLQTEVNKRDDELVIPSFTAESLKSAKERFR